MSESKQNNLTREEIHEACDRLLEKNIRPTNQRIREEVGNRGSIATIQRYRREWFSLNEDKVAKALVGNLSGNRDSFPITQKIDKLVKDLLIGVSIEIEKRLSLENQVYLENDNERLRNELEEAQMNYEALTNEFKGYKEAQKEQIASMEERHQKQMEDLRKEFEGLKASINLVNNSK